MLRRLKTTILYFLLLTGLPFCISSPAIATEMVYVPVNPTFGGNPNNAPGLMSIAQVQNGFTAPALTPIAAFNLNLEKAILSRLTSQTLTSIFGNSSTNRLNILQEHTYDTLAYTVVVSVNNDDKTATITTTDKTNGAVTTFIVGTSLPQ
jgi:curli production assembly/transport component CsgF